MQTVAMLRNPEEGIRLVPALLPGLKRLWFDVEVRTVYDWNSTKLTPAEEQSKLLEAYHQTEFSSLIGVTLENVWTWGKGKDDMEEYLELALLGKRSL